MHKLKNKIELYNTVCISCEYSINYFMLCSSYVKHKVHFSFDLRTISKIISSKLFAVYAWNVIMLDKSVSKKAPIKKN